MRIRHTTPTMASLTKWEMRILGLVARIGRALRAVIDYLAGMERWLSFLLDAVIRAKVNAATAVM